MAGTKGDNDMSFSAPNAGYRLLHGKGDIFDGDLLTGGWSRWGGREKLYMDSDLARLRGSARLPG